MTVLTASPPAPDETTDSPRSFGAGLPKVDRIFHGSALTVGLSVLAITGSIGLFLGYQAIPTLHRYGLHFFTENDWNPELDKVGISAVLLGTFEVAIVALAVSFPLAVLTALFISEYAPSWMKSTLVSAVDLMAAIPSI